LTFYIFAKPPARKVKTLDVDGLRFLRTKQKKNPLPKFNFFNDGKNRIKWVWQLCI